MSEKDIAAALQAFNIETAEPGESTEMIVDEADETEAEEESTLDLEKDEADETEEEDESTLEDDEKEEDEEEADEEDEEEDEQEADEAGEETPTLPDAYYRAALHQGLSKEEVFDMFDTNPEVALKTLASIYKATNSLSDKFASAGQVKLKEQKDQQEADAQAIKSIDIEALEKEYGDKDPLLAALKQQNEQLLALSEKVNAAPKKNSNESNEDIEVLNTFFSDQDMKQYDKFYGEGKDWENLTRIQETNRWSVVEMADRILAGAEAMGQKLKVTEALNMAHINVSEPVRANAIRDEIKKKVVKRSKSRTLGSSAGKAKKNKNKDVRTLEQKTKDRLSKL